jgi:hypothetical protein
MLPVVSYTTVYVSHTSLTSVHVSYMKNVDSKMKQKQKNVHVRPMVGK